jgi:hypothetical protein
MHKILLPLFALACLGAQPRPGPQETPKTADTPKNIILMIGDGMGLTQVSAGLFSNQNSLHLERFPITGDGLGRGRNGLRLWVQNIQHRHRRQ